MSSGKNQIFNSMTTQWLITLPTSQHYHSPTTGSGMTCLILLEVHAVSWTLGEDCSKVRLLSLFNQDKWSSKDPQGLESQWRSSSISVTWGLQHDWKLSRWKPHSNLFMFMKPNGSYLHDSIDRETRSSLLNLWKLNPATLRWIPLLIRLLLA